uniref:Uncharacterized protein n=1 Tax=Anguilla anguilla TaxID=7936 RepID=A0A0E9T2X6_ANGAN
MGCFGSEGLVSTKEHTSGFESAAH